MLELEAALTRILDTIPSPLTESVPLAEARGRYLTEQILAPIDLPIFDNSAMDGYAVRASDVATATSASPVRLRIVGRVAAGDSSESRVASGTCVRLFTGSPLPQGADAVVMQEDTRIDTGNEGAILVLDSAKPFENIRFRGEDVKQGARLLAAGDILTASRICLVAALGLRETSAGRRPVVALLATGSELREPGQPLRPGQIYESNRAGLAALVRGAGAIPRIFALVPDSLSSTREALEEAFSHCDVVVTSGGVSVGEMDFVKQAFEEIGGQQQFWRVAIKPGRPFVFGRLGKKLLFGLPGNPVSALVTFLLLARPALIQWQGGVEVSLPRHPGVLGEPLSNPGERRHFVRVRVDSDGQVFAAGVQASHILSSLAAANGLVDVPPGSVLATGTAVHVMRWE